MIFSWTKLDVWPPYCTSTLCVNVNRELCGSTLWLMPLKYNTIRLHTFSSICRSTLSKDNITLHFSVGAINRNRVFRLSNEMHVKCIIARAKTCVTNGGYCPFGTLGGKQLCCIALIDLIAIEIIRKKWGKGDTHTHFSSEMALKISYRCGRGAFSPQSILIKKNWPTPEANLNTRTH